MRELLNGTELDGVGMKYPTDKTHLVHDYLRKYEFFMAPWKDEGFTLLEFGVFKGGSIATWNEYFKNAKIIGVDIKDKKEHEAMSSRVETIRGDLGDMAFIRRLKGIRPRIIVDDASHIWRHQLLAFFELFPAMEPGGLYILEDISTSFGHYIQEYSKGEKTSPFDVMQALSNYVTAGSVGASANIAKYGEYDIADCAKDVDAVIFIYGTCLIIKRLASSVGTAAQPGKHAREEAS